MACRLLLAEGRRVQVPSSRRSLLPRGAVLPALPDALPRDGAPGWSMWRLVSVPSLRCRTRRATPYAEQGGSRSADRPRFPQGGREAPARSRGRPSPILLRFPVGWIVRGFRQDVKSDRCQCHLDGLVETVLVPRSGFDHLSHLTADAQELEERAPWQRVQGVECDGCCAEQLGF